MPLLLEGIEFFNTEVVADGLSEVPLPDQRAGGGREAIVVVEATDAMPPLESRPPTVEAGHGDRGLVK